MTPSPMKPTYSGIVFCFYVNDDEETVRYLFSVCAGGVDLGRILGRQTVAVFVHVTVCVIFTNIVCNLQMFRLSPKACMLG